MFIFSLAANRGNDSNSTTAPASATPPSTQQDNPVDSGTQDEVQSQQPEPQPEYIEVTATELIAAYDENEVAADNKYKGQILTVTGVVGSIGKDIVDDAYVTLKDESSDYSFTSVQCYFADDNLDDIAGLKEGDRVVIVGECSGGTMNVLLKKCDVNSIE